MNPLLLDLPYPIKTPRLLLRPPHAGDGKHVNEAILESFEQLNLWMPWASHRPSVEETEGFMREAHAKFILRQDLLYLIFDHDENFLGCIGLSRMDWNIPSFESGYWIRSSRTGQGIITEAANALWLYAFKQLHAARIMITCDEDNTASRRIPEKLGCVYEGTLVKNAFKTDNKTLRNTAVYARYDAQGLSPLGVTW